MAPDAESQPLEPVGDFDGLLEVVPRPGVGSGAPSSARRVSPSQASGVPRRVGSSGAEDTREV